MEKNYRKFFYDTYIKQVLPIMLKMEPERQKSLKDYNIGNLLWSVKLALVSLVIFVGTHLLSRYIVQNYIDTYIIPQFLSFPLALVSGIIIFVTFWAIIFSPFLFFIMQSDTQKKFKNLVKEKCLIPLLQIFGDIHKSDKFPDKEYLKKSDLFYSLKDLTYDDNFEGTHNGVKFHITEVDMETYRGVVISFSSNKKIASPVTITKKNTSTSVATQKRSSFLFLIYIIILAIAPIMISRGNNMMQLHLFMLPVYIFSVILMVKNIMKNKKEIVNLEKTSFNKTYDVQTNDQVEARYLLTPAFMERLENLKTAFNSNQIECAFYDDKVIFAIKTKKDLFELVENIQTPLQDSKRITQFMEEIATTYEMIDYFKLDQKTGL